MSVLSFFKYLKAIDRINAMDMLNNLVIADWPNMKQSDRSKTINDIRSRAYPKEKKRLSTKDLSEIFKGSK